MNMLNKINGVCLFSLDYVINQDLKKSLSTKILKTLIKHNFAYIVCHETNHSGIGKQKGISTVLSVFVLFNFGCCRFLLPQVIRNCHDSFSLL